MATHPSQGCYQYPIFPVGLVPLERAPTVKGRNTDGTVKSSTITLVGSANVLSYGNVGPRRVKIDAIAVFDVTNTPYGLSVDLPRQGKTNRPTAWAASYYDGTKWISLVAVSAINEVLLWKPDGVVFANVSGAVLRVSGDYESNL